MPVDPAITQIVRDPSWFVHRHDPGHDAFHFRRLTREQHRAATFLNDDVLGAEASPLVIRRSDAMAAKAAVAPVHFIFHSAFCCSSLLARAFDAPGVAMGLKEPMLLNDMVGWQHRGGTAQQIAPVLDDGLALLARPFAPGEAIVIKPSNLSNGLAPAMLTMRPAARALLLYAPLPVYLGSVAKKGMEGRLWVRDLMVKQLREGLQPFHYSGEDYLGQTDLQIAALGWLAQQALFLRMLGQFGDRLRSCDSEQLLADPVATMTALAGLFGLPLDAKAVAAGPAFATHSKFGSDFDVKARRAEINTAADTHGDEIAKVLIWAEKVADTAGLALALPGGLFE